MHMFNVDFKQRTHALQNNRTIALTLWSDIARTCLMCLNIYRSSLVLSEILYWHCHFVEWFNVVLVFLKRVFSASFGSFPGLHGKRSCVMEHAV